MERTNIILDANWIPQAALAEEKGVARQTVARWIKCDRIDYYRLPGALTRGYLVDRRTAPDPRSVGWPQGKPRK
jgi:hypothetical protein